VDIVEAIEDTQMGGDDDSVAGSEQLNQLVRAEAFENTTILAGEMRMSKG
jgi:hypothetical protein